MFNGTSALDKGAEKVGALLPATPMFRVKIEEVYVTKSGRVPMTLIL